MNPHECIDTGQSKPQAADSVLPLAVHGLTLETNGQRLIDGIDLTIDRSGTTIILGPNGSGKTLLLRLLHGLIEPTSGTIKWGALINGEAIRLRQAMVFQRAVLLRRSVAANIDFVLGLRGTRSADLRDRLLDNVGLLKHARQPARLLSGGEQQRLALARALAHKPDALFLDEPTANLDPASVAMIEDIVGRAQNAGTKIIFVTHDVAQARRLASDVVFLDAGRVAEHAEARHFFESPASSAAKAYLEGRIFQSQVQKSKEIQE